MMVRLASDHGSWEGQEGLRAWPDAEGPDLADLDAFLSDVAAWTERSGLVPDEATRRRLLGYVEAIRTQRGRIFSPLQIAIVGGTGVGKSTLLNALAGDVICETSERRPCTQEVTAYYHEANDLGFDPAVAAEQHRVRHNREPLRDKILIDTPDYDSLEPAHRERLAAALRSVDLVLWVLTVEKYADLAGARWLAEYGQGRQFAFVLNRADEGIDPHLRDDVRRRIAGLGFGDAPLYVVSAATALAWKTGLETPFEDDFERLEAWLERELDAKRVRAVKESNLRELGQRLIARISEVVPPDSAARLDRWREAGETDYREFREELLERFLPRLVADPKLARHVDYWLGTGIGGPVGFCLAAVQTAKAVVLPDGPKLWALGDEPDIAPAEEEDEAGRLARRIAALESRLAALAADSGLPGSERGYADGGVAASPDLAERLDQRVRTRLGTAIRAARSAPGCGLRVASLLLNTLTTLLLLGLPGAFVYDRFGVFWGRAARFEGQPYLEAAALALGLWLVLAVWLVHLVVRVRVARFLRRIREVLGEALDEALREPLLGRLEEHLAGLAAEHRALADLRRRAAAWARLGREG